MKTNILYPALISAALSVASAHAADDRKPAENKTLGEKTSETIDNAVDKTKEVGRAVVDRSKEAGRVVAEGARKTADEVKRAVTPDADSQKADGQKTLGEKASETLDNAVDKTKEVGRVVVDKSKEAGRAAAEGARKAADAVTDAVTPDADALKVEVTLTDRKIDMPRQLTSGKTAFVVRNSGQREHHFEIAGEGIEKKFFAAVDPNDSKTLHVDLKPGSYKVFSPEKDNKGKGMELALTVK